MERIRTSTTLYVGNLSFFTLESQLLAHFSTCGQVKHLIMGLNRMKMQPCGFCFVEYATRAEAALAVDTLNKSVLDGMVIRVDWDYGFEPQRQFGRGRQGGQVRDEIKAQDRGEGAPTDADRPTVHYSHVKREWTPRPRFDNDRPFFGKRTWKDRDEGDIREREDGGENP